MDIFEHPGNLGPTRGTLFTVHHADWPAYPEGEDFRTALLQLTAFRIPAAVLPEGIVVPFPSLLFACRAPRHGPPNPPHLRSSQTMAHPKPKILRHRVLIANILRTAAEQQLIRKHFEAAIKNRMAGDESFVETHSFGQQSSHAAKHGVKRCLRGECAGRRR